MLSNACYWEFYCLSLFVLYLADSLVDLFIIFIYERGFTPVLKTGFWGDSVLKD